MKSKQVVLALGFLLSFLLIAFPSSGMQKPNILKIMLDDLDVELLNNAVDNGVMPNFKYWFVDQGIDFVNSFATTPVCAPSRASHLTGQLAHNHGVLANFGENGGIEKLNHKNTLPIWLSNAGYETAYVGKYINGYGTSVVEGTIPPGWSDWRTLVDPTTYSVFNFRINENGKLVDYLNGEYQTKVISDLAAEFLSNTPADKPFYLDVNPLAPHVELDQIAFPNCKVQNPQAWGRFIRPEPNLRSKYPETIAFLENALLFPQAKVSFNEQDISDKPIFYQREMAEMSPEDIKCLTTQYRSRMASLISVDDMIGDFFRILNRKHQLNKTIVIFTSDNGYLQGEHRLDTKLFGYNESIRVPLYMWMPGRRSHDQITALVNNIDVPVTIAEFAGVDIPLVVDGKSFKPLFYQPDLPWRKAFLIESKDLRVTFVGIRTENEMFAEVGPDLENELYNLTTDPLELENQASKNIQRTNQLRSLAYTLASCSGAGCFVSPSS